MIAKNKLSLVSCGIKYKLRIAFYLMSILPLLVCIYLVSNYILPQVGFKLDIIAFILVTIFIVIVGFLVIREIFDRVQSVSMEAKLIAAGDTERLVKIERDDEIGDLGDALNQLTQRIRNNMDELERYGEKTSQINLEIQKRVFLLSSLLQISSLISQGAKIEDILKVAIEKSRLLANSDVVYLLFRDEGGESFYMKIADGIDAQSLLAIKVDPQHSIFAKPIRANKPLILDKANALPEELCVDFYKEFKLKNTLALPIHLKGRVAAILGIGNTVELFSYKNDDIKLLDIFAKQIAIALENDILIRRVERLEIKDVLTGLYNEAFMHNRLQEEIKRAIAYRRSCGFIILNIDNFQKFRQNFGLLQAEAVLKRIAILIRDSVTDIDRVSRVGDNEFAIILPERNKRQAKEIAEDIRKKIEFIFSEEQDINKRFTVSAGVSENPLDGIDASELIYKGKELLKIAKAQGKNRIIS